MAWGNFFEALSFNGGMIVHRFLIKCKGNAISFDTMGSLCFCGLVQVAKGHEAFGTRIAWLKDILMVCNLPHLFARHPYLQKHICTFANLQLPWASRWNEGKRPNEGSKIIRLCRSNSGIPFIIWQAPIYIPESFNTSCNFKAPNGVKCVSLHSVFGSEMYAGKWTNA